MSAIVFEATEANFEQSVIEASRTQPVLVDFWADWCQPCKTLMPVLLRVVEQLDGRVLLAKVDTEKQQQLASSMGIRSLPTVRLFRDGQAIAEFMGAQPESAIRQFLLQHLGAPDDDSRDAARAAYEAGDFETAERILRDAMEKHPGSAATTVDLASVLLATGRTDDAEALLERLAVDAQEEDAVRRLRGQLRFARHVGGICDRVGLQALLDDADSLDDATLHDGAALRVTEGRFEDALELLLRLLARNRAFRDDAARNDMLAVFAILGSDSPLVRAYRRKLASTLF